MIPEPQRRLAFDGAVNFRDLGGYAVASGRRTRWAQIYRSDSLADLSETDIERFSALGVRTLVDFRLPVERRHRPNRLPANVRHATIELGFVPEGTLAMLAAVRAGSIDVAELEERVVEQYRRFPVDHNGEYRQLLACASDAAGLPLLMHCTSGKDRTGYGVAVILMALGASRELIVEDYLLTNRFRRDIGHLFGPRTSIEVEDLLTSARARYIEAALDTVVERYGSIDDYLERGLHVDERRRARLVDLLTEADTAKGYRTRL